MNSIIKSWYWFLNCKNNHTKYIVNIQYHTLGCVYVSDCVYIYCMYPLHKYINIRLQERWWTVLWSKWSSFPQTFSYFSHILSLSRSQPLLFRWVKIRLQLLLFHSFKFPFDGGVHLSPPFPYQTDPVGFDQIARWDFRRFLSNPAGFKALPADAGVIKAKITGRLGHMHTYARERRAFERCPVVMVLLIFPTKYRYKWEWTVCIKGTW